MITRRRLLGATVAGAVFGLSGIVATRSDASIRFIGRGRTIIALLNTGNERVLFVLGERDNELLAEIVGLTTIGNTRVDLVVASHRVLASKAARKHLHIGSTPSISIQTDSTLPPIRGEVSTITQVTDIALGNATSLRLVPSATSPGDPGFVASITHKATRLLLVSESESVRLVENSVYHLVAVPGIPTPDLLSRVEPQLLVCNFPNLEEIDIDQIQVFRSDPQVVRIGDGSIGVRDNQLSS